MVTMGWCYGDYGMVLWGLWDGAMVTMGWGYGDYGMVLW